MTHDSINRPAHYAEGRAFEPIDVIADWELNYHLGNCLKYVSRAGRKQNQLEDLKKARWYLSREIETLEAAEDIPFRTTYEDVLEAVTAEAAAGRELLAEYGVADVDDQPLEWGLECDWPAFLAWEEDREEVVDRSISNTQKGYVPFDDWDWDDTYMWDPSLGPVEITEEEVQQILSKKDLITEEEVQQILSKKDLEQFEEDEIVSTVERRGLIIGFKRDGSSCLLGSSGKCE